MSNLLPCACPVTSAGGNVLPIDEDAGTLLFGNFLEPCDCGGATAPTETVRLWEDGTTLLTEDGIERESE